MLRWLGLVCLAMALLGCQPIGPMPVDSDPPDDPQSNTFASLPSDAQPIEPSPEPDEGGRTSVPMYPPAWVARGEEVYRQNYCGTCHELASIGAGGIFGPSHNRMAVVAAARIQEPGYTGKATTAAEYIRESIIEPDLSLVADYRVTAHRMPSYRHLPLDDLEALVAFLMAQD